MALIKCKECGKEISDSAVSCPNCGFKIIQENNIVKEIEVKSKQIRTGSIISLISSSIILLFLIMICTYNFLMPKTYTEKDKATFTINIGATKDEINQSAFTTYFVTGIIFTIISFILVILYLNKKIKKIKIYKIALLISSILELLLFYAYSQVAQCCGYIILILPLMNIVGAIIVVTGKE